MKYTVTVSETCTRIYRGIEAESREQAIAIAEKRPAHDGKDDAEHVNCQVEIDAIPDLGWCANCRESPAVALDEETVGDNALCLPCLDLIEWMRENPGQDPMDPRI